MKRLFDAALVAAWLGLFAVLGLQATRADSAPDLFTRMSDAGVKLSHNVEDVRSMTNKWHACGTDNDGKSWCTEFDGIPPHVASGTDEIMGPCDTDSDDYCDAYFPETNALGRLQYLNRAARGDTD